MADRGPSPHDALFRRVFSQPENAADELRHVLPRALVAAIDWTTLGVRSGTWIDEELRSSHADLLYSVQLAGCPALVYVLLEHKSQEDSLTAFQLLVYMVRIWQGWRREHPDARRLPPIVPVVVHHSARGWGTPTNFAHLFDLEPELRAAISPFVPDFSFVLDDLASESEHALHARTMSALGRLALFCLKRARHSGDLLSELRRWVGAMRAVLHAENGADALAGVLSYIMRVLDAPGSDLEGFVMRELGPPAKDAVMTIADEIEQKARAETLVRQLTVRFGEIPSDAVERVHRASADSMRVWLDRVLTAKTLEEVFGSD